jgi:hypothetical protein
MRLLIVMFLFFVATEAVHAQRVDTIINGRRYTCHPNDNGPLPPLPPSDPVICVDTAYAGPFSRSEALRLCEGAYDASPAQCGIKAYAGPFSKEESLNLCIRAYSVGPADCAIKAYAGPFSKSESLQLCGSPYADVSTADCAIRAYQGPYSREESIRICSRRQSLKSAPSLLAKSELEDLLILVNEKAVLEGTYKK